MRDLRRYARQTDIQFVAGFIFLLLVIGEGLIWYFYGQPAALLGLICLAGGTAPIALIWVLLWLAEVIVKRSRNE